MAMLSRGGVLTGAVADGAGCAGAVAIEPAGGAVGLLVDGAAPLAAGARSAYAGEGGTGTTRAAGGVAGEAGCAGAIALDEGVSGAADGSGDGARLPADGTGAAGVASGGGTGSAGLGATATLGGAGGCAMNIPGFVICKYR